MKLEISIAINKSENDIFMCITLKVCFITRLSREENNFIVFSEKFLTVQKFRIYHPLRIQWSVNRYSLTSPRGFQLTGSIESGYTYCSLKLIVRLLRDAKVSELDNRLTG